MRIEEKILINELKKQNREVLEALFMEYFPILTKYAEGFIFDRDACEDIVQGLFVHLWVKSDSIAFSSSIKAYLYQSTKNRCLNHLRDLNIRDRHKLLYLEAVINSNDHDGWIDSEITEKVALAIDSLPPQMSKVFRLKYIHEKKITEIAQNLSISENSVKTHLTRGKVKLRMELAHLTKLFFFL